MIKHQQRMLPFGEARLPEMPIIPAAPATLPSPIGSIDPKRYPDPVKLDAKGELFWGVVNSEILGRRPQPIFGPAYGTRAGQPVIDAKVPELERILNARPEALANDSVADVFNAAIKARRTQGWHAGKGKLSPEGFANIARGQFLGKVLEFEDAQKKLKA